MKKNTFLIILIIGFVFFGSPAFAAEYPDDQNATTNVTISFTDKGVDTIGVNHINQSINKFPLTGEKKTTILILVGLVLILVGLVLIKNRRKIK